MKTSNKILLSTVLIILVLVTIMIISTRIIVTRGPKQKFDYSEDDYISKALDLKNFNSIDCDGLWEVTIVQDNDYSVVVYYPAELEDEMDVHVWDEILSLDNDIRWKDRSLPFKAEISMPQLDNLEVYEGASLAFDGFNAGKMAIEVRGAAEIDADNSIIENLYLRCDGAADANFKNSRIKNAEINSNGASRITLTMDGGTLTGRAHGASSIVYYGSVTTQDIDTAGAVSIRNR